MVKVAFAATQEMISRSRGDLNKKVVIGYDRRFMAPEFAEAISSAVPVNKDSKKAEERLPALPFVVYGCIESKDPKAQIDTSPPFGAFGLT